MELRHLRYFVAVAEELHFGKAAERLHMAQPPLSHQIRVLEEELGVTLFHRTNRRVQLSEAGGAFLDEVYRLFAQLDLAVRTARRANRGEIGRLRLGFVNSASYQLLPEICRAFRSEYPDVVLDLHEHTSDFRLETLEDGTLDVGLYRADAEHFRQQLPATLHMTTVSREPLAIVLPAGHRLAGQEAISVAALASEPFILSPQRVYPSYHDQIVRLCLALGFTPRIVQEPVMLTTIMSLVSAGIGVSIVPTSLRQLAWSGVTFASIADPDAVSDMVAIWRRDDASPVLHAFLSILGRIAQPQGASD
ncbi:MAG TPA: LysR substrate-binding domain-containing protein [Pantanalinema sp.]